jgi:glycosyltransferase involved in cell wall biosynthesis
MKSAVLLHAHDAHALALAGLSVLPSRAPLVVTRRVTFPLRRRFFWRRACRIIAISRAVRDALVSDGIDPARIVVIPSAIDPNLFQGNDPGLSAPLALPAGRRLAVHLGSLTAEKDQQTLIRAAALLVQDLPDLHWVIVGDGALRSELQRQIAQLRVNDRVQLLGTLPDPDRVLAKADLFVMSSTSEGLGSSALAAMAHGVPVIATRVGGLPELLESGGGILVEPRDPGALAEAVRRVLNDSELHGRLAARGRKAAQAYALGPMADQVLSVYRSCAHSFDGS